MSQGEIIMTLKPEELTAFRKTFLPPGYTIPLPAAPAAKQQSPRPATQYVVHPLNQYGFNLATLLEKEYNEQLGIWKKAFRDVVGSLAGAISQKNEVLKAAEAERQADAQATAAFHAMIISLIAIGPMSFLGAYVEHAVVPRLVKLTRVNDPLIMGLKTGSPLYCQINQSGQRSEIQRPAGGRLRANSSRPRQPGRSINLSKARQCKLPPGFVGRS